MSRLPTKLECPGVQFGADGRCELRVEPGEELRCRLLVYNAADRVDEVQARPSGSLADCVRVEPERLPLMPESEGVVELVLDLPDDARVEAGQHSLLVEIRSGLPETEPSVEECAVHVGRVTDAQMSVRQRDAGPGDRWHEVVVESRANHPLRLELEAAAPVDVMIPRPVLDVPPFSHATADLRMAGDGNRGQQIRVEVTASGHGLQLRSQFTHTVHDADRGAGTPPPPPPETPPRPLQRQSTEPPTCMSKAVFGVAVLAALYVYFTVQSGGLVVFLVVFEALWLLFGYAGCRIMTRKGRSRSGGWLFGLLLGPIGLVIAAVLPDADPERQGGRA